MRNPVFSVLKALAILLVVMTHAGCPAWLSAAAYQMHVPAFFICAGYFFHAATPAEEYVFLKRRFRGLYKPFVCWSLVFLLLHNVFFALGVMNEEYGNAAGGVLHPYSWHDFCQRLWSILFNMSGYDEFMAGSFWFFRALLVSSVAWLVLQKLVRQCEGLNSPLRAASVIAGMALLAALWLVTENLRITGVAQGGYREIMGVFFIAVGHMLATLKVAPRHWKDRAVAGTLSLAVVVLFAAFSPASMAWRPSLAGFLSLPLPALAGFVLLYLAAEGICALGGKTREWFVYLGDRTLCVFAFHLLAFKVVSLFLIAAYALPWNRLGSYPVIHGLDGAAAPFLFLLYTIVGVGLPLYVRHVWREYAAQHPIRMRVVVNYVVRGIVIAVAFIGKMLWRCVCSVWKGMKDMWKTAIDFVKAMSPREE